MNSFWLSFVVAEAVTVAGAFVNLSSLPPGVKAALESFMLAGQNLAAALQAGK